MIEADWIHRIRLSKSTYAELMETLPTSIRWYDKEEKAHVLYGLDSESGEITKLFVSVKRD